MWLACQPNQITLQFWIALLAVLDPSISIISQFYCLAITLTEPCEHVLPLHKCNFAVFNWAKFFCLVKCGRPFQSGRVDGPRGVKHYKTFLVGVLINIYFLVGLMPLNFDHSSLRPMHWFQTEWILFSYFSSSLERSPRAIKDFTVEMQITNA